MAPDTRKTVLKTIRFSQADADALDRDAKSRGITFNALVSATATRYLEWDRYADKYGFVALPQQSLRYLTSLLNEDQLGKFGSETGAKNAPAIAHFWFNRLGVESFLNFLAVSAKYCRIWQYEIGRHGPHFVLTVHNDIDPSYAAVHRHYFDQAIRGIVGVAPKIEQWGNATVFTFSDPALR